jgi:DNA-binding response OmpR family regulator
MRILVVEDEHKIAGAIKRGFEQESYAVDAVYDGDEGLSCALTDEYDVIVMDRMLPGLLDGAEITKEVRANGIRTPILLLTAKDKIGDRVDGLNAGADDYLVKPFAFEELLARIRALMRRPQDHVGNVLQLDDLTLRHAVL